MPAEKFAQALMELSELDAPVADTGPPPARGGLRSPVTGLGPSKGLAPEHDILLEHAIEAHEIEGVAPRGAPLGGSAPPRPAGKLIRTVSGATLPVPRAPSVPPGPPSNPLDAFDALDALPFEPVAPSPRLTPGTAPPRKQTPFPPPRRAPTPIPGLEATIDGRTTPPSLRGDLAFSSQRRSPAPRPGARTMSTGGLRLGKAPPRAPTPPPIEAVNERVTPIVDLESFDLGFAEPRDDRPTSRPAPYDDLSSTSDRGPSSALARVHEMESLYDAKNYTGALVLAENVLAVDPKHEAARRCAEGCREALAEKYLARLGGREGRPRVILSPGEMHGLAIDHRAGFLLAAIDGSVTVEEVLDVCSMPALDALRTLFEMKEQGVIEISEPVRRGRR